jgi:hypothetical protein
LPQLKFTDQMRPSGQNHFQMAIGPHTDMKRTIRLIVLFDEGDGISRESTRCSDDEALDTRRLPEFHLTPEIADVTHSDATRLPMFALDNDPVTTNAL